MGKSIRSKVKRRFRHIQRDEEEPNQQLQCAKKSVRLGALPEGAVGACPCSTVVCSCAIQSLSRARERPCGPRAVHATLRPRARSQHKQKRNAWRFLLAPCLQCAQEPTYIGTHTRARARARTRTGACQSISTLIFRAPRRTPCAVDPKDSEPARFNFNPCLQPDKIAIRDMIVPANSVRAKQLRVSVKPGTEGAPHHLLICTRAATHGECERRGWFIQSTLLSVAVAHADQAAPEERTAPLCRNGGSTNAHGASDRDGDAHRRQASAEN